MLVDDEIDVLPEADEIRARLRLLKVGITDLYPLVGGGYACLVPSLDLMKISGVKGIKVCQVQRVRYNGFGTDVHVVVLSLTGAW